MEAMNPQQQLPPNYLDEISPQTQKRSFVFGKTRLILALAILAVVIVIILSVVAGQIGNSRKEPWERLSVRLASTAEIVESSDGVIKNSQLRSTNSNLKISLTNTTRDLAGPLATIGIATKKIAPSVVSSESNADMLARLEDARLNAKYDSTYAREMSFQLANILTLLRQLYTASSNETNKKFLLTTYDNFEPVQKSLADFSASNE